ncbi:MAG: hypothetical protein IPO92_08365 [Saprospiraceae bacterium]|nr:hypothetical protein [Saprospiraceae bacterium]
MKFYILLISFLLLCSFGCKEGFLFNRNPKDPLIVKVGDRSLFKSQLDGIIGEGTSLADSAAITDGFIQNWIRENLMINEAEKNVAADINLDKLVDDYRSSLLVYNYEKRLVDQKLDTIVSYSEKLKFYNENKNQYILSHPILKCVVAKIPSKAPGFSTIRKAMEKSDLTETMYLFKEKASFHFIDTAKWLTVEDLNALVPSGMIENERMEKGRVFQKKEKDSEYFVKIIRYYDENKIPPFEYIEDKITKVILSDRKIQLLKQFRQNLYDNGIAEKGFEIFK